MPPSTLYPNLTYELTDSNKVESGKIYAENSELSSLFPGLASTPQRYAIQLFYDDPSAIVLTLQADIKNPSINQYGRKYFRVVALGDFIREGDILKEAKIKEYHTSNHWVNANTKKA